MSTSSSHWDFQSLKASGYFRIGFPEHSPLPGVVPHFHLWSSHVLLIYPAKPFHTLLSCCLSGKLWAPKIGLWPCLFPQHLTLAQSLMVPQLTGGRYSTFFFTIPSTTPYHNAKCTKSTICPNDKMCLVITRKISRWPEVLDPVALLGMEAGARRGFLKKGLRHIWIRESQQL